MPLIAQAQTTDGRGTDFSQLSFVLDEATQHLMVSGPYTVREQAHTLASTTYDASVAGFNLHVDDQGAMSDQAPVAPRTLWAVVAWTQADGVHYLHQTLTPPPVYIS